MSGDRLSTGGRIDRQQPIEFKFNRKSYSGFQGDTLASALIANGITVTARSFKFHRPRGIVSCGIEEPGTYVELSGELASANQPPTQIPLTSGLSACSINCWPSARHDLFSALQLIAPLIPAGFYYKTFMRPSWSTYEWIVRKLAGRAHAPTVSGASPTCQSLDWHCDVLVIGGGPAGIAAAQAASQTGSRVVVADMNNEFGGSLLGMNAEINRQPAMCWVETSINELMLRDNVILLPNTLVWAYREHNLLTAYQTIRKPGKQIDIHWRIRAKQVVLATGANERMLVFPNNDRPGVMLASAVERYIKQYSVRPGRKAVLYTNNDFTYSTTKALIDANVDIVAIIDTRSNPPYDVLALAKGMPILTGHEIVDVGGRKKVHNITVSKRSGGRRQKFECDLLAISGGWNPSVQLWSQARGALRYSQEYAAFIPNNQSQPVMAAGAANCEFTLADALQSGVEAGMASLEALRITTSSFFDPPFECNKEYSSIEPYWYGDNNRAPERSFVDLLNDVTLRDIHLAVSEGYTDIELVKRYTTSGMAMDQGRTGNLNTIGAVAINQGKSLEQVGYTTFRSPVFPVPFGPSGQPHGPIVRHYRTTPVTQWNIEHGAVMYEAGAQWQRPGYYPKPGESMQEAINREAVAVRRYLGVYDASTLGTFEIKGKDSTKFLDLLYTCNIANIAMNMGRYGIMLTEDGLILDDGVCFRLSEHRFLVSTSTGNASVVYRHMTRLLEVDYPELQVKITDVTCQWMNATICGPEARNVLKALGTDIDISPKAFPFMFIRKGHVNRFPAYIARVSFTGELSFEINVRPRDLLPLWKEILQIGKAYKIAPVGSETSHVLRVEKGFISLGHEVDGTIDPYDLGMAWIISSDKVDFIGKRSIDIHHKSSIPRRQLVGLLTIDPQCMLAEGAPILGKSSDTPTQGFVSASVWSVVNNRFVALGLLEKGAKRHGENIRVRIMDEIVPVKVTEPCFHDPAGKLLRS